MEFQGGFEKTPHDVEESPKGYEDITTPMAEERIKDVDMDKELADLENDDEAIEKWEDMTDPEKLKNVIKAMQLELARSRHNHQAPSTTKSHLEEQTFDLTHKLESEQKKY